MAINGRKAPYDNETSFVWLANVCGFPSDRNTARAWSEKVFDANSPEYTKNWDIPEIDPQLNCEASAIYNCRKAKKMWPLIFTIYNPQPPEVGGDYWRSTTTD